MMTVCSLWTCSSRIRLAAYSGVLCLAFCFGLNAHAQNVHGILRVVKGNVQIKSAKSGQMVRARLGEKVFPKDVIITAKDARAKIVMVDNNEINVSPESQIEIQHYEFDPAQGKKDVLLNVIYGKVRSKVEQKYDGKTTKFHIKTPGAVAGVRGTDFMTGYNRQTQTSQVVTFEGRVEFGVPAPGGGISNPVMVTPGTQANATAGQAPSAPAPVPKEELAKVEQESKAETAKGDQPSGDSRQPSNDSGKKDDAKSDGAKSEGASSDGAKAEGASDGKKADQPKAESNQAEGGKADSGNKQAGGNSGAAPGAAASNGNGESSSSGDAKGSSGDARSPASTTGGGNGPRGPGLAGPTGGAAGGPGGGAAGNMPSMGNIPGGGAGSMLRPEDMAGGVGAPVMPSLGPAMPNMPPVLPTIGNQMPVCDPTVCNNVINGNSSRLIIRVK